MNIYQTIISLRKSFEIWIETFSIKKEREPMSSVEKLNSMNIDL